MKLSTKLLLAIAGLSVPAFGIVAILEYQQAKNDVALRLRDEARTMHALLMATREVYHDQFRASGLPVTEQTLGFLPAHALGRISGSFHEWETRGLTFNQVSDRPRNPENMADPAESEAIGYFREHPEAEDRLASITDASGEQFLHYARPIRVDNSCLECHGQEAKAPPAVRARYDEGYNYRSGDLHGILSIKLPAAMIEAQVSGQLEKSLIAHLAGLALICLGLHWLLRKLIIQRLKPLDKTVAAIAAGDGRVPVPLAGSDEIASVFRALEAMQAAIAAREKLLRQSKERFRQLSTRFQVLFDAIPNPLRLISPEFRILWANRAAVSATGLDISELTGRLCYQVIQGRSRPCEGCQMVKCLASGGTETSLVQDRQDRTWRIQSTPVGDEVGGEVGVIEWGQDITEELKLETESRRTAQLASLGELAAGIAHEIDNPLTGIVNHARLLSSGLDQEGREREIVRCIIKESERIAVIVRNLLSFAGQRKESPATVCLQELLTETLALVEAHLRRDGIHLTVDMPPSLPHITAFKQQLQQVVLNLLSNARDALNQKKFTDPMEKILEIRGEWFGSDGRPWVRLVFHDRGAGIPEDLLDRVLIPFFTTKPPELGPGLGLSISHGIIREHGGRLRIESVEGAFTEVRMELPVTPPEREHP